MKDFVWEYIPEFVEVLTEQLKKDEERWGNTWQKRTRMGQEQRIWSMFDTYYDQFQNAGKPVPWLKIAGLALIAWIRELEGVECE